MWFHRAEEIEAATPQNFLCLSKKIGFCDRSCIQFKIQFLPLRIISE